MLQVVLWGLPLTNTLYIYTGVQYIFADLKPKVFKEQLFSRA